MPLEEFINRESDAIDRERSEDAHSDAAVENREAVLTMQSHRYLKNTFPRGLEALSVRLAGSVGSEDIRLGWE